MNITPTENNAAQATPRKKVVLLKDSHYNPIDETLLRKNHYVQVRNHPGASSTDLLDHLKPVFRNSPPDHLIYHGACNDLKRDDIHTIANLQEMVKMIREKSPSTKLSISLLFPRNEEPNIMQKVTELNNKIKTFCKTNKIDVLSNPTVHLEHLGKKHRKLH